MSNFSVAILNVNDSTVPEFTDTNVLPVKSGLVLQGSNDSGTNRSVTIKAPTNSVSFASSYTLQLPPDDGSAGQALSTDGSGVLSWVSVLSGDTITVKTVNADTVNTEELTILTDPAPSVGYVWTCTNVNGAGAWQAGGGGGSNMVVLPDAPTVSFNLLDYPTDTVLILPGYNNGARTFTVPTLPTETFVITLYTYNAQSITLNFGGVGTVVARQRIYDSAGPFINYSNVNNSVSALGANGFAKVVFLYPVLGGTLYVFAEVGA